MKYDKYGFELETTSCIDFIALIPKNIASDLSSLREIFEKSINTPTYNYSQFLSFRNLFYIDTEDLVKYDLDYKGHVFLNPCTEKQEYFYILVLEDAVTAREILKIAPNYILMESYVEFEDLWSLNDKFLKLNSLQDELPKLETGEYYLLYRSFSATYSSTGSFKSNEGVDFKIGKEILEDFIYRRHYLGSKIEILFLDGHEYSHNYDGSTEIWNHPYNKYHLGFILNFFNKL